MVELSGKANKKDFAAFDVPAAALMEIYCFWDVVPCCLLQSCRRFSVAYCHHLQGLALGLLESSRC